MKSELAFLIKLANAPLTKGEQRMLKMLSVEERKDGYEPELVYEKGGGWWIGTDHVSGRVAWNLIRKGLVSQDNDSRNGDLWRLSINSMGRARLDGKPAESALAPETLEKE